MVILTSTPTQDQLATPEEFEIDSRIGAASKENSRPQGILKFRPPSSLDYKARHGPQTFLLRLNAKRLTELVYVKMLEYYFSEATL